jgi:hypothetical protein
MSFFGFQGREQDLTLLYMLPIPVVFVTFCTLILEYSFRTNRNLKKYKNIQIQAIFNSYS